MQNSHLAPTEHNSRIIIRTFQRLHSAVTHKPRHRHVPPVAQTPAQLPPPPQHPVDRHRRTQIEVTCLSGIVRHRPSGTVQTKTNSLVVLSVDTRLHEEHSSEELGRGGGQGPLGTARDDPGLLRSVAQACFQLAVLQGVVVVGQRFLLVEAVVGVVVQGSGGDQVGGVDFADRPGSVGGRRSDHQHLVLAAGLYGLQRVAGGVGMLGDVPDGPLHLPRAGQGGNLHLFRRHLRLVLLTGIGQVAAGDDAGLLP